MAAVAAAVPLAALLWRLPAAFVLRLHAFLRGRPARARVLQLVQDHPGIHFNELVRLAALGNGQAALHVDRLVRDGLVTRVRSGRYHLHFAGEAAAAAHATATRALKAPAARQMLDAIARQPGLSPRLLARATGLTERTVFQHLPGLEQAGLVRRDRAQVPQGLHPTAATRPALAAAPSAPASLPVPAPGFPAAPVATPS